MPQVRWSEVGSGIVVESIKRVAKAELERKERIREAGAEVRRLDRLARDLNRRYGDDVEKNEKKIRDVITVLQTQRQVSAQVANAAIRDVQKQSAEWKKLDAIRRAQQQRTVERLAKYQRIQKDADDRELQNLIRKSHQRRREEEAAWARADALVRRNETPRENYRRHLREVIRLHRDDKLSLDQRRRAVAGLRREFDGMRRAQRGGFGGRVGGMLGGNLQNFLMTSLGAGAAIGAVRGEIQEAQTVSQRRADLTVDAAAARRGLLFNISAASDEERRNVTKLADETSKQTGLLQTLVDQTMANAVSAAPSIPRAAEFAAYGLSVFKDLPGSSDLIGGALDIANSLGTDDPREAFGFMAATLLKSRAEDPRKLGENLPRVVQAGKAFGLDPSASAALFAGLSVAGADKNLEVSRSASINLFRRAAGKFFTPDKASELGLAPEGIDEVGEQVRYLLRNPSVAPEFVQATGFRAAAAGGLLGLLGGLNPEARVAYEDVLAATSDREALIRSGARLPQILGGSRFEGSADLNRYVTGFEQQIAFSGPPTLGAQGVESLRSGVTTALNANRVPAPRLLVDLERLASAGTEINLSEALDIARGTRSRIDQQASSAFGRVSGMGGGYGLSNEQLAAGAPLSDDPVAVASREALDRLIEQLERLSQATARNTDATEEQNRSRGGAPALATGAEE